MKDFPEFMQHSANRIATGNQATPGVEGYVFDGVDGSQMAFWTCRETIASVPHAHDYDEYMLVVQGRYTLIIDANRIPLDAGDEYFIPRGVLHAGEVIAGTRTIQPSVDIALIGIFYENRLMLFNLTPARFPPHPIQHPFPSNFMVSMRRWWRQRLRRNDDSFPSIPIRKPLKNPTLFLDPAIIGEQPQAVLERVELELPVHVVTIPIREPTYSRINRGQPGFLQPLRLLPFIQRFDAGVELLRPHRLSPVIAIGPNQHRHSRH